MNLKHTMLSLAVIAFAGVMQACINDGNAGSSGVSQADFDALAARVAALEANPPGDKAYSGGVASAAAFAKAATANATPLGTALAFNGSPQGSSEISLKSSAGYLYSVNLLGANGVTGPTNHEIFYESADCSGQGYISGISDYGAQQGYVFAITAEGGTSWDNPAQFYYVPAGSIRAPTAIDYQSRRSSLEEFCAATSGTEQTAFPVLANDAEVTGVASAAIETPITLQ